MRWQLHLFAVKSYDLEVPFQAAGHGGMGHVGRTDIGGGKPGIPPEIPGLGMEPFAPGVIGYPDLHVGQVVCQPFDSRGGSS